MRKQWLAVTVFSMIVLMVGTDSFAQEAKKRWEMLNLIRKEKFDQVLPGALRDNNVDMWIHAVRDGDPDPLTIDLGGSQGYFVFTDRGGDRIERAVFSGWGGGDVYDIRGGERVLRAHVEERDPEVIAVNYSEWIAVADGISHTGYKKLVELLGDKYAKRIVSAENVITDFRVRRTQSEIIAFANTAEMHRQILEKAMSSAVITPGITSRQNVGWWIQDRILEQGLTSTFGNNGPSVLYSAQSDMSDTRSPDYIYQPGDFLTHDMSVEYLNYGTDYKRNAYILREGENAVPEGIQYAFDQGLKAREVIKKNFKVGRTPNETIQIIGRALEEAGFGYIHNDPTTDGGFSGIRPGDQLKYPDKTEVSIDFHSVGNTGNSEVAVGPSMASFRPDRGHLMLQHNHLFSFEYVCYTAIPELNGEKLRINFEDNHVLTNNGVEWLYPPNEKIILIQ